MDHKKTGIAVAYLGSAFLFCFPWLLDLPVAYPAEVRKERILLLLAFGATAAITYFVFRRLFGDAASACCASIAYLLSPCRLGSIHVRGDAGSPAMLCVAALYALSVGFLFRKMSGQRTGSPLGGVFSCLIPVLIMGTALYQMNGVALFRNQSGEMTDRGIPAFELAVLVCIVTGGLLARYAGERGLERAAYAGIFVLSLLPLGTLRIEGNGSGTLVRMAYMAFLQLGAMLGAWLLAGELFQGQDRSGRFFFTLFYMTSPWRIHVCYELSALRSAALWTALPFCVWIALKALDKTLFRSMKLLVPSVIFPAVLLYGMGGTDVLAGEGYELGDIFSLFAYADGRPGIGCGMLSALTVGIWLSFVEGIRETKRLIKIFSAIAGILLILCSFQLPPAVFGLGSFFLCAPCAEGMRRLGELKNAETAAFLRLITAGACVIMTVCQCNLLAYGTVFPFMGI